MANKSQFNLEKYAEEANKIWHNKYEYVDFKQGSKKNPPSKNQNFYTKINLSKYFLYICTD